MQGPGPHLQRAGTSSILSIIMVEDIILLNEFAHDTKMSPKFTVSLLQEHHLNVIIKLCVLGGIRIANPAEMVKEASVVFMAVTQVEFNTVANVLTFQLEGPSNDSDIKRVVIGFCKNMVVLVSLAMDKRSMRAYRCTKALLTLAESSKFFL